MELELNFTERILLGNICNPEDTYANLVIREDLTKKLMLTQKEIEAANFKNEGGNLKWDDSNEKVIKVEISNPEKTYLAGKLKELDLGKKLNCKLIKVYGKIV
jgi:hypothetical protein